MAPQGQPEHEHDLELGQPNGSHTELGARRGRTGSGSGEMDRDRDRNAHISDPDPDPDPDPEEEAVECAVCLGEFADGDAVRVMPACGHRYHASCIERWLAGGRRSSCPTCRAPSAVVTTAAAAAAAAAAAQPDEEATNRREPNSGALSAREVGFLIMLALHMTWMLVDLIDNTVRHFRGK